MLIDRRGNSSRLAAASAWPQRARPYCRVLDADVAAKFLEAVLRHPEVRRFLSDDHFSVDGTLVEARASLKNFRAKDSSDEPPAPCRNGERDFHGENRAKLHRKGKSQPAKLYFMGHALIENRHGLVVQADATEANGTAERKAALALVDRHDPGSQRRLTLGAEKATTRQTSSRTCGRSA